LTDVLAIYTLEARYGVCEVFDAVGIRMRDHRLRIEDSMSLTCLKNFPLFEFQWPKFCVLLVGLIQVAAYTPPSTFHWENRDAAGDAEKDVESLVVCKPFFRIGIGHDR